MPEPEIKKKKILFIVTLHCLTALREILTSPAFRQQVSGHTQS